MHEINAVLAWMNDFVIGAAGQPWVYAVVFIGCIIDGFFPPIPSESIVVGLGSLAVTQGIPNPVLLVLSAAFGAFVGDNVAWSVGRRMGGSRWKPLWGRRMQASLGRAGAELDRRGASMILAARFIPVGRVAVNLAAGATGFPRKRFLGVAAVSATLWATYMVVVGAIAGAWFRDNGLLGMGAAIVLAGVLGLALDRLGSRRRCRAGAPAVPEPAIPDVRQAETRDTVMAR